MKKYLLLIISLLAISAPTVMAISTGGLRISPQWPIMVSSPSPFTVWAQSANSYDVNVLLVTTEECYSEFADAPAVVASVSENSLTIELTKDDFTAATSNSEKVPGNTTPGAGYTVASLKDHLDYGLSTPIGSDDTIYWAIAPLNFDLTTTPTTITVSEEGCSNPRMLIYLLGKSVDDATLFDMNVPPTNPGFMVPEITAGSIMAAATMFGALGLYTYRKKHQQ